VNPVVVEIKLSIETAHEEPCLQLKAERVANTNGGESNGGEELAALNETDTGTVEEVVKVTLPV